MAGLQGRKCRAQNAIPQYMRGFRASWVAPSSAPEELLPLECRDTLPTPAQGPAPGSLRGSLAPVRHHPVRERQNRVKENLSGVAC